jgi:aryl-alcohol dehydrogenase-like predicted oxidoreductase
MQRRTLDRAGRTVGELGFGGRGLDRASERILCEAIESGGVDLVDVSPAWGDAEAVAGAAVRALRARDHVVVATSAVGAVRPSVEASLRAIKLDALPLVWVEDAELAAPSWPDTLLSMRRLVDAGDVLGWGLVVRQPDRVAAALDEPTIGAIQVEHHLDERGAATVIAQASERGVGVVVRRPLAGGALGGDVASTPEAAIRVAKLSALVGRAPPAALRFDESREVLAAIARPSFDDVELDDVAELALRWVLDAPVAAALVGMRSRDHLRANLRVSDGRPLADRFKGID